MPSGARTWLARHAQTLVGSLGRIVQNPIATTMTMAVIARGTRLAAVSSTCCLQNTRAATADWNQAFELSVYLNKKAGIERAAGVGQAAASPRATSRGSA